uniref:Uncharacterized protein n=1 Tax=Timema tahoe TaxID=61484 RepID=A0A7R9FMI4_9NEOP|nr:unnamed protein product [Timema tahoe]
MLDHHATDPQFLILVLTMKEATFTRNGSVDLCNQHIWADTNPNAVLEYESGRSMSETSNNIQYTASDEWSEGVACKEKGTSTDIIPSDHEDENEAVIVPARNTKVQRPMNPSILPRLHPSHVLAFKDRSFTSSPHLNAALVQEVKEGFGNQINLCQDRGLNPGPSTQKSDTLPLDHQVTDNPEEKGGASPKPLGVPSGGNPGEQEGIKHPVIRSPITSAMYSEHIHAVRATAQSIKEGRCPVAPKLEATSSSFGRVDMRQAYSSFLALPSGEATPVSLRIHQPNWYASPTRLRVCHFPVSLLVPHRRLYSSSSTKTTFTFPYIPPTETSPASVSVPLPMFLSSYLSLSSSMSLSSSLSLSLSSSLSLVSPPFPSLALRLFSICLSPRLSPSALIYSSLALSEASAASLSRNLQWTGSLRISPTILPCTSCWLATRKGNDSITNLSKNSESVDNRDSNNKLTTGDIINTKQDSNKKLAFLDKTVSLLWMWSFSARIAPHLRRTKSDYEIVPFHSGLAPHLRHTKSMKLAHRLRTLWSWSLRNSIHDDTVNIRNHVTVPTNEIDTSSNLKLRKKIAYSKGGIVIGYVLFSTRTSVKVDTMRLIAVYLNPVSVTQNAELPLLLRCCGLPALTITGAKWLDFLRRQISAPQISLDLEGLNYVVSAMMDISSISYECAMFHYPDIKLLCTVATIQHVYNSPPPKSDALLTPFKQTMYQFNQQQTTHYNQGVNGMLSSMRFTPTRLLLYICVLIIIIVIWTLFKKSQTIGFTRTCPHPEQFQDQLHQLADKVNRVLSSLQLTHFLCYGSLWGQIRLSRSLPWEADVEFCLLNEELSLHDEVFLTRAFKKHKLDMKYNSAEGLYMITDPQFEGGNIQLIVFEEDTTINMLRRVGWKRRMLPPNCEEMTSLECFPPRLIARPLPLKEFGGYILPVPREGIEIQKYHYQQSLNPGPSGQIEARQRLFGTALAAKRSCWRAGPPRQVVILEERTYVIKHD